MIKKLRQKFVIYATLSVFALLLVILTTINVTNFALVANDADKITLNISKNNGKMNHEGELIPPEQTSESSSPLAALYPPPGGPDSQDMKYSVRYFTVSFDKNNNTSIVAYEISTFSETEVIDWATSLKGKTTGWSKTYYRYRVYKNEDKTLKYVTVIDQTRELTPSYNVLWASLIGSSVGVIITLGILIFVSKLLVKPFEDSDRKQKRFIADATHKFRTPLTIISTNNEIEEIEKGESDNTKAINKQILKLNSVITDLAELSKLNLGEEEEPVGEPYNISKEFTSLAESYKEKFKELNKNLELDIGEDLSYTGNKDDVNTLFIKLLDNALRYSVSKAKFTLKLEGERIVLIGENDARDIQDGPIDTIFENFHTKEESNGNGLGLPIAKAIVKNLKGRIYAKGENGNFIIRVEL